jgi:hypothetical protein
MVVCPNRSSLATTQVLYPDLVHWLVEEQIAYPTSTGVGEDRVPSTFA